MKLIYLEDIELEELEQISDTEHKESTLFHDQSTVYKIFNDLNEKQRKQKQTKVKLLSEGRGLPITVMPKEALVYGFLGNRFEGYTMDYIEDSKTLYKSFRKDKELPFLINTLNVISTSLQAIHQDPRNIIISDLHAENIIIDRDLNPHIIDIDSCKIDSIKNETIPMSLMRYLSNRGLSSLMYNIETTVNTDRLCLLLMTVGLIFNKHIDRIPIYEYDKKAEQIKMLNDLKQLVLEVKKSSSIPDVPYIHELISDVKILQRKPTK